MNLDFTVSNDLHFKLGAFKKKGLYKSQFNFHPNFFFDFEMKLNKGVYQEDPGPNGTL